MPQPAPAYTDPNGATEVRAVTGLSTPAAPRYALAQSAATMLQRAAPLIVTGAGASGRPLGSVGANPGAVDMSASALITFPAIYKPFNPGSTTPTPTRYPVMREYPPIIRP